MKTFRPQDFIYAALYVLATIGPALLGLVCHGLWVGLRSAWSAVS